MAMFLLTLLLEVVFLVGVIFHLGYFNGSPYWQWDWRQLSYLRTASFLAFPLIPYIYALLKIERFKDQRHVWRILLLIVLANFLFQLMGMAAEPRSFESVRSIIVSRRATSYFYEANLIRDVFFFLENFHLLDLRGHSSVHPPGPILFYYVIIQLVGADAGAYVGGFTVALMASAGVLVLYFFSSLWAAGLRTRLTICAFYALIPGVVLFFPQFDQVYPIFSMLMIHYWEMSLRESRHNVIYFGLVLFIATFFAYNLLVIGAFHVLSAIAFLLSGKHVAERFRIVVHVSLLAIGTAALCYLALFWATGFNPVLSFARGFAEFSHQLGVLHRPYGFYLFYNFYEFFLGSGIIVLPLVVAFVVRNWTRMKAREHHVVLSFLGLATILVVDLTGLLPAETTRVWLFLQPLIMIPIGLELIRMDRLHRWMIFVMLWVNLVVLKSNMWFIIP